MGENIDTSSPTGRRLLGVLSSFAEFERERIRERIHSGLARATTQGTRLERRRSRPPETRSYLINGLPQSDSLRRPDRSTLRDYSDGRYVHARCYAVLQFAASPTF